MQVGNTHVSDYKNHNHQGQWYESITDQGAKFEGADIEVRDWVLGSFGQNNFCKSEYQNPYGLPKQVWLKTNLIQVNTLGLIFPSLSLKTLSTS
jgi:hypothetical protein